MRALVLHNKGDTDAGVVAERAVERGFDLVPACRERHDALPDPTEHDLVISLGSVWSVYWDDVQPSVAAEQELLRHAHEAGVPVLAICFGAQLFSVALGGVVARLPSPEIGWHYVESDAPDLVPPGPWFQWHYDAFTVPEGAVEVARNHISPQAFRVGHSLAVQFHPEVDERIVATWAGEGGDELRRSGIDPAAVLGSTRRHATRARRDAHCLFDAFWDCVARRDG